MRIKSQLQLFRSEYRNSYEFSSQLFSELKPVLGYLIILIIFALGATFLVTLEKGWDSKGLDEAIQQTRLHKKAFTTRDMPENIRPAAAVGLFYPADPDKLST